MASISKRYCSVPQCNSYVSKDISLHYFPRNSEKLCKEWQQILRSGKPISKYMNVCSKHFVASYFMPSVKGNNLKIRRLKPTAVPSENLPIRSHEKPVNSRQTKNSLPKLSLSRCKEQADEQVMAFAKGNILNQMKLAERDVDLPLISIRSDVPEPAVALRDIMNTEHTVPVGTKKIFVDRSTQTADPCESYNLQLVLNTYDKLKTFTNVDFSILQTLCDCAKDMATYNNKKVTDFTLKIMLVLIKIRLNIPFTCLAILFNLSASSVRRYFHSTLSLLSLSVKPIIYWHVKEEILANMPKCFQKYQNTRVVFDCTEIQVDRWKCLNCRILTYPHYKGRHTVKYLIGITPSGTISFVSSGYGGRTSDKAIFNRENIVEKFDPQDGIMVDKGILIEKECEAHLLKLIRPPFLKKKKISKADAEETANIARARVHVERAIERIKTYSILQGQIPWYMVPYTNDIMTVVAALVNISRPILADDKFLHHVDVMILIFKIKFCFSVYCFIYFYKTHVTFYLNICVKQFQLMI